MSRETELAVIADQYNLAEEHIDYAYTYRGYAYVHWQAGQELDAIYDLTIAVMQNNFAIDRIVYNMIPYDGGGMIHNFLSNYTGQEVEPTAIDMSAILDAMVKAEPHQPLLFVAYLEAYYASVWNASFDEQFFADLVKKWSIWG